MYNIHIMLVGAIAALLSNVSSYGQETNSIVKEPKTQLEAFEAKTGAVIIKGIQDIGSVSSEIGTVTVGCREFIDATTGHKEYGIVIAIKEGGRLERESATYIDYDEIDSLLKGIDYISKVDKAATSFSRFEAVYKTRAEFRITTFNDKSGETHAAVSSGRIPLIRAFVSLDQLTKLRGLLDQAKTKLDSIRKVK